MTYEVTSDGHTYRLDIQGDPGCWRCQLDGCELKLDAVMVGHDVLSLLIDGRAYEIRRERTGTELKLSLGQSVYRLQVRDPRLLVGQRRRGTKDQGPRQLVAPMSGKVVRVLAGEETAVESGQGVIVVEAMKMQNELKSPKKGVVKKVLAAEGAAVNAGDVLAIVE